MQMNEFFYGGNGRPHWQAMDDAHHRSHGRTVPTYEFRVPMCCSKCEEKVREELLDLDGVFEVYVDRLSELVSVTGFVDPFQALKKMRRIKKKSEFWEGSRRPTLASSLSKKLSALTHHPRHHDTVYRSSASQVSYNRAPYVSNRRHYASYDDQYGSSYRPNYGAYDDGVVSYRTEYNPYGDGVSYRSKYGGYLRDGVAYSDLVRPSSSSFSSLVPRSRASRYEYSVPPYAQDYYTEEYVQDYPVYNRF